MLFEVNKNMTVGAKIWREHFFAWTGHKTNTQNGTCDVTALIF